MKSNYQLITACLLTVAGCVLLFAGLIIPPSEVILKYDDLRKKNGIILMT